MGKRKNKHNPNQVTLVIDNTIYIEKGKLREYIKELFQRFDKYNYISLSGSSSLFRNENLRDVILVTVHRWFPEYKPDVRRYIGRDDHWEKAIRCDIYDFQGMIFDRNLNCCVGNPFSKLRDDELPNLGSIPAPEDLMNTEMNEFEEFIRKAAPNHRIDLSDIPTPKEIENIEIGDVMTSCVNGKLSATASLDTVPIQDTPHTKETLDVLKSKGEETAKTIMNTLNELKESGIMDMVKEAAKSDPELAKDLEGIASIEQQLNAIQNGDFIEPVETACCDDQQEDSNKSVE